MYDVNLIILSAFATTVLTAHAVGGGLTVLDQCSIKTSKGSIISLQEIDDTSSDPRFNMQDGGTGSRAQYYYNPCTPIHAGGYSNVLIYKKEDSKVEILGNAKLILGSSEEYFTYEWKSKDGTVRTTSVYLFCDKFADQPSVGSVSIIQNTFTFMLTSKCCCADACKYDPNYFKHAEIAARKRLSTGSILCITLLVIVIVYIVGGVLVNTYLLGKEGYERIPNREFWKDLPPLIMDGCGFTYSKACRSGGDRGQYQQIA